MHHDSFNSDSGRAASMKRRRAMALGKTGLPVAAERVRTGFRTAGLRPDDTVRPSATKFEAPQIDEASRTALEPAPNPQTATGSGGREASLARRRLLVQGKAALGSGTKPVRRPEPAALAIDETRVQPSAPIASGTGRELAMARRAALSRHGRGAASSLGGMPAVILQLGEIRHPPKVTETRTAGEQRVTGYSANAGRQMTGGEAGQNLPVSGTQYIGPGEGGFRSGGAKVGHARTEGGSIVSGTMVRSKVRITGDEPGASVRITGRSDQILADDLSERSECESPVSAQFARQANPHGQTVFGTNLGHSARSVGSRDRDRSRPIEVTATGQSVSGTAIGRSVLVTGDEQGACTVLTGSQYLSPAQIMTACGGPDRSAPAAGPRGPFARRDPVTGGKVAETQTWRGQTVTGTDLEHSSRVTGSEPGTCNAITGTPYLGATTVGRWCDPVASGRHQSVLPAATSIPVTGDVPLGCSDRVSGMGRGALRSISGTPYQRSEPDHVVADDPILAVAAGFSISSPQRSAHMTRRTAAETISRISGSFAAGNGKLTGTVESAFRDRLAQRHVDSEGSGCTRLTGEGKTSGTVVSGDAWIAHDRVTGTEGFFATGRNPSERGSERKNFVGAAFYKGKVKHEASERLVTGAIGWSSKSAAVVTLSGGAQG